MNSNKLWLYGLPPVIAVVFFIAVFGVLDSVLPSAIIPPSTEHITVERVQVSDQGFVAKIRSEGRDPLVIAQVMVDGAYWVFSQDPPGPIARIDSALITIKFPWIANETHHLRFITSTGATFEHTIEITLPTPSPSWRLIVDYGWLGIFVGLFPVAIGMLCYPAIKRLGAQGLEFILALTIGLLAFLFVDMTLEGFELSDRASPVFGGQALVLLPMILTLVALLSVSQNSSSRHDGMRVARLIALGIGFHNFGEGLVIGAALAVNKIAMGAFLIFGFTLHNTTEGLGLVAPLVKERPRFRALVGLALLAGLPVVPGIWIGAFSLSPHWAAIFFGIGAGAILQVIVEIDRYVTSRIRATGPGSRFGGASVAGYCAGVGIMYGTSLLIVF